MGTPSKTGGTEFVDPRPGERLIAVSPQQWKGTPTTNGRPVRRDDRGRCRIESISTAGALVPTPSALARRDDHDVTFARIVTAPRRAAILPPYRVAVAEAFSLR